jgi:hypothetical protein
LRINWDPPKPRSGLLGEWDKFIGPGATKSENIIIILGAILGLVAMLVYTQIGGLNWSRLQIALASLIAFDVAGGVVANATNSAKRWYHRTGQEFIQQFIFILIHGVHILIIAIFFRDMDWMYFFLTYSYLLISSAMIIRTPISLQRPVALLFYGIGLLLSIYTLPAMPGLQWFLPLLYLKLLVSHLIFEAPFSPN